MPIPCPPSPHSRIKIGVLGLLVCAIALLPWWHNHDYLRDFYDYGLFINVNARLAEGQRPFVDYTTPAQSGAFLLNYAAEWAGGGTYVGMTRGAAALIVISGLGLMLILVRRFTPAVAALLALAITVGSASQHTIIFYNPLGVIALALTVWSFAMAPLLKRATLGWHILAAAGLFLGGINKINFHLLACVMAVGWVLYAWIGQKAAASRVLLTTAFIAAFGFLLPIGLEITWTGAGWRTWVYNVIELPLGARGGRFSNLFTPALYLTTLHNYYGQLRVPQVGLIGVLMPLVAVVAAWRRTAGGGQKWRAGFLVLAGLLAVCASSMLLLTNNEIAYVTFAAALVIAIGLWLGFEVETRSGWLAAGLLIPALILAAAGWESAWDGDRSQFGHDREPRTLHQRGEQSGGAFSYLRGLNLPSGLAKSLTGLAAWRHSLPGDESRQIYYGPGTEWLERVWSVKNVKGQPLIASAFDSQRENDLLIREVISGSSFLHLLVVEAWDNWSIAMQDQLEQRTMKQPLNGVFKVYHKLPRGTVSGRPLKFMHRGFGGNVDSLRVISDLPLLSLADQRLFLGLEQGEGRIEVGTPCHRMSAEYVLARPVPGAPGAFTVKLAVHARMGEVLLPRWNSDVTLPDGVDELVVPIDPIDGSGLPLTYTVTIPTPLAGKVRAGWRAFYLSDTPDRKEPPPILRSSPAYLILAGDDVREALVPASMQDATIYLRNGRPQAGKLLLPFGGEVWIQVHGTYTNIKISAMPFEVPANTHTNFLAVYYKGGRLDPFAPTRDAVSGTVSFSAWTPEPGGWIGIFTDDQPGSPSMLLNIESATRQ